MKMAVISFLGDGELLSIISRPQIEIAAQAKLSATTGHIPRPAAAQRLMAAPIAEVTLATDLEAEHETRMCARVRNAIPTHDSNT